MKILLDGYPANKKKKKIKLKESSFARKPFGTGSRSVARRGRFFSYRVDVVSYLGRTHRRIGKSGSGVRGHGC